MRMVDGYSQGGGGHPASKGLASHAPPPPNETLLMLDLVAIASII